jgi:hypothetical protein
MQKIALTVAILLGVAFTVASASAATKHRRPAHVNPPTNNAAAGVSMTTACLPSDSPCPFRKSYPRVAMMQPRQDGRSGNVSVSLDRATQRRILVQR